MQFALVDDNTDIPLKTAEVIEVPFRGRTGTPTCSTAGFMYDTMDAGNYFKDDFGVFIPTDEEPQPLVTVETDTTTTRVVQFTVMTVVIIAIGFLLKGI